MDIIILVQEVVHSSMKHKEKCMAIKNDLANVFDRVRHEFRFTIMSKLGFDPTLIRWIKACIGEPWITPLVTRKATKFFKVTRDLQQGCPLSPFLFLIQASSLSFQLEKSFQEQDLIGLRIIRVLSKGDKSCPIF